MEEANKSIHGNDDSRKNISDSDEIQNSTFDILTSDSKPINKDFLMIFSRIANDNIDPEAKKKCKILKFTSEWSYDEILTEISNIDPKVYQNLFVFVFELKSIKNFNLKNENNLKSSLLDFSNNRPLVLQVTSETQNVTKVFYKVDKSDDFIKIEHQSDKPENFNDFKSFFWFYMNTKAEDFEDLMRNIKFGEQSPLILRFLRTLELSVELFRDLVLKCGSCGSVNDLLALLDVPFGYESGNIESTVSKCLSQEYEFKDGDKSVLSNAVEQSNEEVIKFLVKNCRHLINKLTFYHQCKISTAALAKNQMNYFCDFIELCDFPFPKDFNPEVVTDERLKEIIQTRNEFHEAIKIGNQTKIMKFIESNPTIKIAFNSNNDSALYTALDSKKFEVLCQLKSYGFLAIEYDDVEDEITDPNELQTIHKHMRIQRLRNVNSARKSLQTSINSLSNKSYIHNKNISEATQKEYHDQIRKWYEEIYTTELNRLQIDIAVTCPELKLIYDFESETTTSIDHFSRNSEGVTYTSSKWIFIGAKFLIGDKKRERRIKGVIAHEINHYVLKMVYQNDEHPYFKEDKEAARIFMEITEVMKILIAANADDECDQIISIVFTGYESKDHQAELAVRVAHILAQYGNDKSKILYLSEKYKQLFDYVQNRVISDLKKFLTLEHVKVRELNRTARVLSAIKALDYDFVNVKDTNELTNNRLTVVTTNQPKLLLLKIYKDLQSKYGVLVDTKNIFIDFKTFNNSKEFEDILINNPNLNVFVDCSEDINENMKHIASNDSINFVFVVSNEINQERVTKVIENSKQNPTKDEIIINWNNLDTKSQDKLLQTEISIRNHQVKFLDLFSKSDSKNGATSNDSKNLSKIMDDQMLNLILNHSIIEINSDFNSKKEENDFEFSFISRSFNKFEDAKANKNNFSHDEKQEVSKEHRASREKTVDISEDQLLTKVQNEKYVVLSDIAGSGKSWAMQNYAEILDKKHSTFWVSRIELKEYIKVFKAEQGTEPEFANFMIERILRPKTKAEAEFFSKMYKLGKVFIFFDGFDEIAPDCAEFVTKLIKSFESNNGNQLWIATRDYFEVNLQEKLKIDSVYTLQPFTEQNGIDLITSSWILNELGSLIEKKSRIELKKLIKDHENYTTYQDKARILNQRILDMKINLIGIPQFFKIVAIVMRNSKDGNIELTLLKIYEKFVEIQYEKLIYEKGDLRKMSNINNQFKTFLLSFIELHMYFAMRGHFTGFEYFCDLEFNSFQWVHNDIIACGLLKKIGDDYFFIHETLREYFAAKFIVRYLMRGGKRDDKEFCDFLLDFLTLPQYGIIRMFLDEALNDVSILEEIEKKIEENASEIDFKVYYSLSEIFENNQENLKSLIAKIFNVYSAKWILFESIETIFEAARSNKNCAKLLEFVFSFLNVADAKDLMMKVDENDDNFILLLVGYNKLDTIEETIEIIKNKFSQEQFQEILESKGFNRQNILQSAAYSSGDVKAHRFLWNLLRDYCKTDENFLKYLQVCDTENSNIFDIAAGSATKEVFEFMIEEIEKLASSEEVKRILSTLGCDDRNLLQSAASNNTSVEFHQSLWKIIEKYFEPSEILQMLKHTTENGSNIMHLVVSDKTKEVAVFVLNKMLTSVEIITKIEIFELLKQSDNNGWNIFHYAFSSNNKEVFEFLWNEVRSFFVDENSLDEFKEMLLKQTLDENETILHISATNCDDIEFHTSMWQQMLKYFDNPDDLYNFVFKNDTDGNNFVHNLIASNELNVIEKTFEILKKTVTAAQYQEILKSKGSNRRNLLHIAACNSKPITTHQFLWKLLRDYCKSDEIFLKYLQEFDTDNSNIFDIAAGFATKEIFEFMIEKLEEIASHEEVKCILSTLGSEKRNLLQSAQTNQNQSLELQKSLWEIMKKYFDDSELIDFIIEPDKNGCNLLYYLYSNEEPENFVMLWSECKSILEKQYLTNLYLPLYEFNESVNYFLNNSKKAKIKEDIKKRVVKIEEIFRQKRSLNSYRVILSQCELPVDIKVIHQFSFCIELECHRKFLEHLLKTIENRDDLAKLMLQKNPFGKSKNYIHLVVSSNKADVIELTLNTLRDALNKSQFEDILVSKDEDNLNLLQTAASESKDDKEFKFLWNLFRDIFKSDEDFIKFLKEVDNVNDNVFHMAAHFLSEDIFKFMFNQLEEIASPEELKSFINSKGCDNFNLLHAAVSGNESLNVHQCLWNVIEKYFNDTEILEMIYYRDEDEDTILHNVVQYNSKEIAEFTWKKIKCFVQKEADQVEYFKLKGHDQLSLIEICNDNQSENQWKLKNWIEILNKKLIPGQE